MNLGGGYHARAHFVMCKVQFHHMEWWSAATPHVSLVNRWWVFLARGGHYATQMCEMNAGDISDEFSVQFCYPCQGVLLKRSGNSLNKEWKKKYVTLSNDGILTYHSSVNVSWRVSTGLGSMIVQSVTNVWWQLLMSALTGVHAECSGERDGLTASDSEGAGEATSSRRANVWPPCRTQRAG